MEDEREEEREVYVEVAAKEDLLLPVEAGAVPDVTDALDIAVVLEGAEIVVNAENAPKVICGVVSQSQL